MADLDPAHRAFLGDNPFPGVATTLRADGSPHSTVVWVDVDERGVSFNTADGRAKPRHLRADPRVSLTVVDPNNPFQWISLSGTATVTEEGADAQIDRLAKKYLGQDTYPWRSPDEQRLSVRITPDKVDAFGFDQ
jgi:PPOX class probable F420-dependent enzyme